MARKKHSHEEIEAKLKLADKLSGQGKLHKDIARALGVSIMTFHRWRKLHQPFPAKTDANGSQRPANRQSEAGSIEVLEQENARLRLLVTDLLLEKARLEEALDLPGAGRIRTIFRARQRAE